MVKSRKKFLAKELFIVFALLLVWPLDLWAACEEDCQVPKSCKEYLECRTAQLECIAACKQKEAWEISERASEKIITAAEKMTQVLEKTMEISEKLAVLLDKLASKLTAENPPQELPEIQP